MKDMVLIIGGVFIIIFICICGTFLDWLEEKIRREEEKQNMWQSIRRSQRMNQLRAWDVADNFDKKWKEFVFDTPWHIHFYYLPGGDQIHLPDQGYKLHFSAGTMNDYICLVRAIVPYLEQYGASYKVVNPYFRYKRDKEDNGIRQGKDITVYQKKWDARGFFMDPTVQSILFSATAYCPVKYDVHVKGRVYMRYGGIMNNYVKSPDGMVLTDDRTKPAPDFVKEVTLDAFIRACYE